MVTHLFYDIKKPNPSHLFTSCSVNVTEPSKALHIETPKRRIVLDLVTPTAATYLDARLSDQMHIIQSPPHPPPFPPPALMLRVYIPSVGQAMREK